MKLWKICRLVQNITELMVSIRVTVVSARSIPEISGPVAARCNNRPTLESLTCHVPHQEVTKQNQSDKGYLEGGKYHDEGYTALRVRCKGSLTDDATASDRKLDLTTLLSCFCY